MYTGRWIGSTVFSTKTPKTVSLTLPSSELALPGNLVLEGAVAANAILWPAPDSGFHGGPILVSLIASSNQDQK